MAALEHLMGLDFACCCLCCAVRSIFTHLLLHFIASDICKPGGRVCLGKTESLEYISTYFSTMYFHFCKNNNITHHWGNTFYKNEFKRLSHLPNLYHRGRHEHYYILQWDHKQNNQHKTWLMERDPNIKAAPGVFMAKHLEYFKMEIQVSPL